MTRNTVPKKVADYERCQLCFLHFQPSGSHTLINVTPPLALLTNSRLLEICASFTKAWNSLEILHLLHGTLVTCILPTWKVYRKAQCLCVKPTYCLHKTFLDTECRIVKKSAVIPFVIVFFSGFALSQVVSTRTRHNSANTSLHWAHNDVVMTLSDFYTTKATCNTVLRYRHTTLLNSWSVMSFPHSNSIYI